MIDDPSELLAHAGTKRAKNSYLPSNPSSIWKVSVVMYVSPVLALNMCIGWMAILIRMSPFPIGPKLEMRNVLGLESDFIHA
jgi:hypothetical protein